MDEDPYIGYAVQGFGGELGEVEFSEANLQSTFVTIVLSQPKGPINTASPPEFHISLLEESQGLGFVHFVDKDNDDFEVNEIHTSYVFVKANNTRFEIMSFCLKVKDMGRYDMKVCTQVKVKMAIKSSPNIFA